MCEELLNMEKVISALDGFEMYEVFDSGYDNLIEFNVACVNDCLLKVNDLIFETKDITLLTISRQYGLRIIYRKEYNYEDYVISWDELNNLRVI